MAAALSPLIRTLRCGRGGQAARLQVGDIRVCFFCNHRDREKDQFQCRRSLRTDLIYSLRCFIVDFIFLKTSFKIEKINNFQSTDKNNLSEIIQLCVDPC